MSIPHKLNSHHTAFDSVRSPESFVNARLRKHADYQSVYAGKVLGKAHERNRIKRRMREILRRHLQLLPSGFDLILHPRRSVLTVEFSKLEAEIVRILGQANAEAARSAQSALPRPTV
jgi:ribonuclease P protein component